MPYYFSIRLDSPVEINTFPEYLKISREHGSPTIALEFIVQADTQTWLPKINRTCLAQYSKLLPFFKTSKAKVILIMNHNSLHPLFSNHNSPPPHIWFKHYHTELKELILNRSRDTKIHKIFIGNYFWKYEQYQNHWRTLTDSLQQYTGASIGYSTIPEKMPAIKFWNHIDEIGIHFLNPAENQERSRIRYEHKLCADAADKYNKPLFITQVNLIGINKLDQLKNRMKFWESNTRISGIILNTIFPYPVFADTNTQYFGIINEPAILQYLKSQKSTIPHENSDN